MNSVISDGLSPSNPWRRDEFDPAVVTGDDVIVYTVQLRHLSIRLYAGLFFLLLGVVCLLTLSLFIERGDAERAAAAVIAAGLSGGLGIVGLVPLIGLVVRRPRMVVTPDWFAILDRRDRVEVSARWSCIREVGLLHDGVRQAIVVRLLPGSATRVRTPLGILALLICRVCTGHHLLFDDIWSEPSPCIAAEMNNRLLATSAASVEPAWIRRVES